jgi:hypothetical protein
MAKVTGPLYSMSASGKIANAMVFFGWKGTNVVRQWLKPSNPQSAGQGDARLIMGGTGKAVSAIKVDEAFHGQMKTLNVIPGGQTKQSFGVKKIIDTFLSTPTLFEAEVTAYEAHLAKTDFDASASAMGLVTFDIEYKATSSTYAGGLMVYLLARLAIQFGFTGSPYSTALADWTVTEIGEMETDLQGV